jgi:hypothetical protein
MGGRIRVLLVTRTESANDYSHTKSIHFAGTVGTCYADGSDYKAAYSYMYGDGSDAKHKLDDTDLYRFEATATAASDFEDMQPYGYAYEFNPDRVDLARAEAMVKVLKHVAAYLDKRNGVDGYTENIGQWFSRVAQAVGATAILFEAEDCAPSTYNTEPYRTFSTGDAVFKLNRLIGEWQERMRAERAA